ncbi:MAG: hypothetical protein Q9M36_13455 [Sulfurovum sp.]|nr:hypothetical protein [Sulfurovum sp.]
MKNFHFIALLLTGTLCANDSVQIDMHGGKDTKLPSAISSTQAEIFYGTVLEIKEAMGYKYLKIQEKGQEVWIAISNAPVSLGEKIGYDKQTLMQNFSSTTLGQTFDKIYFSSQVYLHNTIKQPQSMKAFLGIDAHKAKPSPTVTATTPFVQKDLYSTEEVHLWRKDLKDQNISIEGTVGKVSHQIMKRNWIHIGELVLTTAPTSTIKTGDKVIAKGSVTVDKDFGYGYFYPVLIENTSFEIKP